MKKYFYSVLAAGMMLASSCSQDQEIVDITKGEGQKVTFKVEIPEASQSRAVNVDGQDVTIGGGKLANKLIYAQYEAGSTGDPVVCGYVGNRIDDSFTVELTMAKDINYDVLFLAYNPDNNIFGIGADIDTPEKVKDNVNLKALTLKNELLANQEAYDAFVGAMTNKNIKDTERSVSLTRPFAQVNAITTANDLAKAATLGIEVSHSQFIINKAPYIYNIKDGAASGEKDLTYSIAEVMKTTDANPVYPYEAFSTGQYYLATAYVLAGANASSPSQNLEAELKFYRGHTQEDCVSTLPIPQLPVQRNYRTNVMGDLLTKTEAYTITIDKSFVGDHIVNEFNATSTSIIDLLQTNKDKTEALSYNVENTENQNDITITIPDDTEAASLSFNLKNLSASATVTITNEGNDTDSYDGPVVVEVPEVVNLTNLTINLPSAHVTIKQGDFANVIATTSGTTLIIPKDVKIQTLEIQGGNAEIYYGAVTGTIEKQKSTKIIWLVDTKEQLKNIATQVNEGTSFEGQTIKLTADIDLNNEEWTPIGVANKLFSGTFDGQNHTISNFKITEQHEGEAQAALFGNTAQTVTFRNLTISKANINCQGVTGDFYGSALIGTAYGNVTIENVDVVDSYISGNNKVGALLAHDGEVSSLKIDGCDVSNVKFETTNIEDGGSVGGLVGYFQGVEKGEQAAPYGEHYIKNSTVKNCTFNVVNSTNTGKRANGLLMSGLNSKKDQVLYITDCTTDNNTWNEKFYVDGTEVTEGTFDSPFNGLIGGERYDFTTTAGKVWIDGTLYPPVVAKVGETEYNTIEAAIANWTNNTTLTLLKDVTLSDVITLKSTEHHILNLGTYTMTAAEGKNAIEITCEGQSSASYALTVNADADNAGGITAKGKACVYYSKSGTIKDRPIIRIYNGVFNGSYSINSKSNGNTNCPQVWIYGGTFNGNVNLTKNMLRVWGGTFHGWVNCTGDTSAYREISGGRFKSWQFMTADSSTKFWVGTAKETYDVGVYVDDEGYLVVGGPVITGFGDKFTAKATNPTKWSPYLQYSSAAANGLYYTNAEMAIKKHGETNVEVKK